MTNELQLQSRSSKDIINVVALGRFGVTFLLLNIFAAIWLMSKGFSYIQLQYLNITGYCLLLALIPRLALGLCWKTERIANDTARSIVLCFLVIGAIIGSNALLYLLTVLMPPQLPQDYNYGISTVALGGTIVYELLISLCMPGKRNPQIVNAQAPKAIQQQSE